jgi:hypothetical protein
MNDIGNCMKGLCVIQWFHFEKDQPSKFVYKNTLNEKMPFDVADLKSQAKFTNLKKKMYNSIMNL